MKRTNLLNNTNTVYAFTFLFAGLLGGLIYTTPSFASSGQEYIVEKKKECNLVQTAESLGPKSEPLTESMIVTTSDEQTVSDLKNNPCVLSVGKNRTVSIASKPNDPQFEKQWALENTGQTVLNKKGTPGIEIGY
ncbi:MAG: hypothetical protein ABEI13_04040, partial [Candidatus Paceibacteria bacterium]